MSGQECELEGLARLQPFVGAWRVEGTSYAAGQRREDPCASAAPWASDETYEWLAGNRFLIHRWEATAGDYAFTGLEIIGYDCESRRFFSHLFDNGGHHAVYDVACDGQVWRFTEAATRAKARIADDRRSICFAWEWRNGGRDWLPLCDRVARRV